MQTGRSSGTLTTHRMDIKKDGAQVVSGINTGTTEAESTDTTARMTIFFDETSVPSAGPDTAWEKGMIAPRPTPVEYFENLYGTGVATMALNGISGTTWTTCSDVLPEGSKELLATLKPPGVDVRESAVAKEEVTKQQGKDVKPRGGIKKKGKEGVRKRIYRKCNACGTRNHNRRLICTGCYGGKDEIGKNK